MNLIDPLRHAYRARVDAYRESMARGDVTLEGKGKRRILLEIATLFLPSLFSRAKRSNFRTLLPVCSMAINRQGRFQPRRSSNFSTYYSLPLRQTLFSLSPLSSFLLPLSLFLFYLAWISESNFLNSGIHPETLFVLNLIFISTRGSTARE